MRGEWGGNTREIVSYRDIWAENARPRIDPMSGKPRVNNRAIIVAPLPLKAGRLCSVEILDADFATFLQQMRTQCVCKPVLIWK
jgi:hypothetical protein